MDEPKDRTDESQGLSRELGSMERRQFLTKAAAAGAIAWAAPMILSHPAYADNFGGTPKCRPTITVECADHMCELLGIRDFPGFAVTTTDCPCSTVDPTRCIRITNLVENCIGAPLRAYRSTTPCGPFGGVDENLADGGWHCLPNGQEVWFGRPRVFVLGLGLIIPSLTTDCTISFTLDVWASCPDRSPADGPAFACRTWNVLIAWDAQGLLGVRGDGTCTITATPASPNCVGTTTAPPAGCAPCSP